MLKIKFLVMAILISFAGIISSCYYDYGIDPDSSNVVVTAYNNTYDFASVTKYILDTAVHVAGGSSIDNQYASTIINTTRTNLNNLGWTQAAPGDSLAAGVVLVSTGVTTATYTVNSGDYWWYGGGYYYYYPPYYSYSYSYTTGTVAILIADLKLKTTDQLPIQWSGVMNGAQGQVTPVTTLITQGINQAFTQSPYLR